MGEEVNVSQRVHGGHVWTPPRKTPLPAPDNTPKSFTTLNQLAAVLPYTGAIAYSAGFLIKIANNQKTDVLNIPQLILSYMANPVVSLTSVIFIGISGLLLTAYVGFKPFYNYPSFSEFMTGKVIYLILTMLVSLMLLSILQFIALDVIHNWLTSFRALLPSPTPTVTPVPNSHLKFF